MLIILWTTLLMKPLYYVYVTRTNSPLKGLTKSGLSIEVCTNSHILTYAPTGHNTDPGIWMTRITNIFCPNWIVFIQCRVINNPWVTTLISHLLTGDLLTLLAIKLDFLWNEKKARVNSDQKTTHWHWHWNIFYCLFWYKHTISL